MPGWPSTDIGKAPVAKAARKPDSWHAGPANPKRAFWALNARGLGHKLACSKPIILTSPLPPPKHTCTHPYTTHPYTRHAHTCTYTCAHPTNPCPCSHTHMCTHTLHTHSSSHSNSQSQGHTHMHPFTHLHTLSSMPPSLPYCCWASYIPAGGARFVHRAVTHLFSGYPNR